jgi:hypothetical protein
MPWFKCRVRGENFPLEIEGEPGSVGFYTTRFVEATDEAAAELAAVALLCADPKLAKPSGAKMNGPATVHFEEITEVAKEAVPAITPGYVFFSEVEE